MAGSRATQALLRRGTLRDFEGFWRCLDAVARERRYLALVEAPPLEEAHAFLEDARSRGMVQILAVAEGEVVGWCDAIPKPYEGMRHCASLGMGLLPPFRGRGVGARMLAETLEGAAAQGITRVELEVFATNERAIALYERRGFLHEGRKRGARVLDGCSEDILCMALRLGAAG